MPRDEDWELKLAFIRLEFPPAQRDLAHSIAVILAEFIGAPILRLRPEHTIGEIFAWSDSSSVDLTELIVALEEEFGREIDDDFALNFEQRTFREFVECFAPASNPLP